MTRILTLTLSLTMISGVLLSAAQSASAQLTCTTPYQHLDISASGGSHWELCWVVDSRYGLIVKDAHFIPVNDTLPFEQRQVFAEIALAGVLLHSDAGNVTPNLLNDSGQATEFSTPACDSGSHEISAADEALPTALCQTRLDYGYLNFYPGVEALQRSATRLQVQLAAGSMFWQQSYDFGNEGTVTLSMSLSGSLANPGITNPGVANPGHEDNPTVPSLAINYTWRVTPALAGTTDDMIWAYDMLPLAQSNNRSIVSRQPVVRENLLELSPTSARRWLIQDPHVTSDGITGNGIGYLYDPQNSGFIYANADIPWTRHPVAITRNKDCERLTTKNTQAQAQCAESLTEFLNDEAISSNPVLWLSAADRIVPGHDDTPYLRSRTASIELVPFDWTDQSPLTRALQ